MNLQVFSAGPEGHKISVTVYLPARGQAVARQGSAEQISKEIRQQRPGIKEKELIGLHNTETKKKE